MGNSFQIRTKTKNVKRVSTKYIGNVFCEGEEEFIWDVSLCNKMERMREWEREREREREREMAGVWLVSVDARQSKLVSATMKSWR